MSHQNRSNAAGHNANSPGSPKAPRALPATERELEALRYRGTPITRSLPGAPTPPGPHSRNQAIRSLPAGIPPAHPDGTPKGASLPGHEESEARKPALAPPIENLSTRTNQS
jgi:hypothetical protein